MTVIRRRLKVGELVEVHKDIDPLDDWSKSKGMAVILDTNPDPERPGLIEVRYVRPRGLPEEQLPIQKLINNFSCVRVK
jgi:hypothetical protein